jgi:hypothetical protein
MLHAFGAGAMKAHVVCSPPGAKGVASGRELADQVLQVLVMRSVSGLRAEVRDELVGKPLPFGVELRRGRIQEDEAGAIGGLLATLKQRRIQGAAELVGGDQVTVGVGDDCRRVDLVEDATSSRRNPATRREPKEGSPACSGVMRARLLIRNAAMSSEGFTVDPSCRHIVRRPAFTVDRSGRAKGGIPGPPSRERQQCSARRR